MRRGDREYPVAPGTGWFAECAETTAMARTASTWTFSRSQRVVGTSAQRCER